MLPFILIPFAALPIVVGGIYSAAAWHSLSYPMLFTLGGILEGYIVAGAVLYWAFPPLTSMGVAATVPGVLPPSLLAPFERVVWGAPIVVVLQLLAMWCTHRAVAHS
jgi:hypothetical protein